MRARRLQTSAVPRLAPWAGAALARQATLLCALACAATEATAGVISLELERVLATRGTHADTAVIVRFADRPDLQPLAVKDRRARDGRLILALQERTARQRARLAAWLDAQGATRRRELWIINGLAATLPADAVKQLALLPGIARVDLDSFVQGGRQQRVPQPRTPLVGELVAGSWSAPAVGGEGAVHAEAIAVGTQPAPAWNIAALHAPALWALGHTGRGVVVATMDTGADLAHPMLRGRWRGGRNSWFDPHGEQASPSDAVGHGTQALGVIVGGPEFGVAPDARWIAVRLYDGRGHARMSDIHAAFQWLMDPDGDPSTADAPDVVNASWALSGRASGTCVTEFEEDIRVLESANIVVVFAAGNDGPAGATSNSPGNNPGVISVGAVDRDGEIARQSSRGPSACDGGLFPRLVAPGVNIRTTDLSHGGVPSQTVVSGSSLAAPHVAGVLALLAGAFPSASVDDLKAALLRTARDLGATGADPVYGQGLVDALAAFQALGRGQSAGLPAGSMVQGRAAAMPVTKELN